MDRWDGEDEDSGTVERGNFPRLFNPAQIAEVPWGSTTVTLIECDNARIEWTTSVPGFQSGRMPVTRLTSVRGNDFAWTELPDHLGNLLANMSQQVLQCTPKI